MLLPQSTDLPERVPDFYPLFRQVDVPRWVWSNVGVGANTVKPMDSPRLSVALCGFKPGGGVPVLDLAGRCHFSLGAEGCLFGSLARLGRPENP